MCVSPDLVPQVDPLVAVLDRVRSEWKSFGLPAAVVTTRPGDQTLAGATTLFSTPTPPRAVLPPKDVLGYRVTLTVTASRYVWDFGDGSTQTVPAATGAPSTRHVYRTAGPLTVTLRTYYTATFTINGGTEALPLAGEADVPGTPTPLTVREARSQLEAGAQG